MKRPTELIEMLDTFPEIKLNHGDAEKIYDWINYIESRIQPVSVNEKSTGYNAATQPRKTVSDAVEAFKFEWPSRAEDCKYVSWTGYNFALTRVKVSDTVCTREEFEAEVERRKGEKDPHEDVSEGLPYIITDANGFEWERVSKSGSSATWKKRKPSISKAEAWNKAVSEDASPFYILENYEVK